MLKFSVFLWLFLLWNVYASSATAQDVSEDALGKAIYSEALDLLSAGKEMEPVRKERQISDEGARQCGIQMRSNQEKARHLRDRVDELPFSLMNSNLKLAVSELRGCVSCSKDALEDCKRSEAALDQYKGWLKN